jgi:hypothetical protein
MAPNPLYEPDCTGAVQLAVQSARLLAREQSSGEQRRGTAVILHHQPRPQDAAAMHEAFGGDDGSIRARVCDGPPAVERHVTLSIVPLFEIAGSDQLVPFRQLSGGADLYESEIEDLLWDNFEELTGETFFRVARQPMIAGGRPDMVALDHDARVVVIGDQARRGSRATRSVP